MKLPSGVKELSDCYVIDRLAGYHMYYLWTIHNDEWVCMATSDDIGVLIKRLEKLCEKTTALS